MKSPERAALLGSAGVKSLPYFSHETAGHIHFLRPPDAHFSMEYAFLQKYIDFSFDGDGTPLPPRWKQFKTKREKAERTKAFQDAAMKILPYHIAISTDKPGESTAKGPLTTERGWHNLACYLFCYCAAIVHNPPCPTKILIGLSRPTAAALTPTTDDRQMIRIDIKYGSKKDVHGDANKKCCHQKNVPYGMLSGSSRRHHSSEMFKAKEKPSQYSKHETRKIIHNGHILENRSRGVLEPNQTRNLKPEERERRKDEDGLGPCGLANIFRAMAISHEADVKARQKVAEVYPSGSSPRKSSDPDHATVLPSEPSVEGLSGEPAASSPLPSPVPVPVP